MMISDTGFRLALFIQFVDAQSESRYLTATGNRVIRLLTSAATFYRADWREESLRLTKTMYMLQDLARRSSVLEPRVRLWPRWVWR